MNKANELAVNIFISIGKPEIFYPNQNGLPTIDSIDVGQLPHIHD